MLADGHHLHPALHRDVHQPIVNGLMGQAQHPAHGNGGQAVVNAEFAGHVHLYVHLLLAFYMEADAQKVRGSYRVVKTVADYQTITEDFVKLTIFDPKPQRSCARRGRPRGPDTGW